MYKLYSCVDGFGTRKIGAYDTIEEARGALKADADLFFEFFEDKCKYTISCGSYLYEVTLSSK